MTILAAATGLSGRCRDALELSADFHYHDRWKVIAADHT